MTSADSGDDGRRALAALLDRDLVCVDLETTGGNSARHRILEIGLVALDRDGRIEEWSTLVNPGTRIPPTISAFTGIDEAMVADAPSFEDVHRELLRRLEGRLFIAHNARFDYGFIKSELRRLEVSWQARTLCTVKLSRRLYPGERRHNLDALILRHGLGCEARHRALGDARVLRDLLSVYARDLPAERLRAAVETVLKDAPLPPQLPADLADELPESAGVYRFYGEGEALLYVGKSKNLKTRVLSHFGEGATDAAARRLATLVRRVEWQETAGELGALLAESRAVKTEAPLLNRRLRGAGEVWTLALAPAVPGAATPVSIVTLEVGAAAEGGECYGLFRRARDARLALEQICRAQGLCLKAVGLETGAGSCFGYQLGRCRGACVGAEPLLLHATRLKLALASTRLKPWPYAGRIAVAERDWRGQLDLHVFAGWRYLGTVHEPADIGELADPGHAFDIDVYRLLLRHLGQAAPGAILEEPACTPA